MITTKNTHRQKYLLLYNVISINWLVVLVDSLPKSVPPGEWNFLFLFRFLFNDIRTMKEEETVMGTIPAAAVGFFLFLSHLRSMPTKPPPKKRRGKVAVALSSKRLASFIRISESSESENNRLSCLAGLCFFQSGEEAKSFSPLLSL